ncbi:putative MFS-type transporter [Lachnellula occidentalis]|uniref:Putative MFS-type transporter n=1 Tax=Lachnellula occidentalis TaxID=215460 RepID=A0A8H8UGA1_9HELO|nr:putative MFS-type transporter [Lachnellula occidentalis]
MGLWILEPKALEHVPGTSNYFDDPDRPQVADGSAAAGLKCDTSGPVRIILVPQPSDDPNDPLVVLQNWPLWKRDTILFILALVSIFATSCGSILSTNTITLSLYFELPFTKVAALTGYFLLGTGVVVAFCVPSARIWGKRHLFLLGTVIIVFSSVWAGATGKHYGSMVWARFFQGIGCAPFEILVNAAVGDLYFVHERGKRMALANLAVFGGAFFTPVVVGKITHTLGWEWSFYFVSIFSGICLPLVFFYVPETAFNRAAYLNTDLASTDAIRLYQSEETAAEKNGAGSVVDDPELQFTGADTKVKSFRENLMPINGRVSDENFWKLVFRPFPLFAHPAVFWACLTQSTMIGWTVFIGIIIAAVFLGPPLFWDEVQTGYAYAGAFIGAILGFVFAGVFADWSAKYMTRKNNGVYEPEFRIILVIPQLIFGCTGLYLFAVTASNLEDYSWMLPIFAFGLQVAGMIMGTVSASLYIVDAHRGITIEAFTCTIMFKNFFAFGITGSGYDWLVKGGVFRVFVWAASIQILICLLSIPMYLLGKRNRSFFHRHDILKMCKLR